MNKEIAIIGYGRFGRCAAHHLKKYFRIVVADVSRTTVAERGIRRVSVAEASQKPVVLLAVPIHRLKETLRHISPLIKPGSLVCDVCSVKEEPVRLMKKLLARHVSSLSLHPLFGPESASKSLKGRSIVLCPVRISNLRLKHVRSFLQAIDLRPILMTPAAHDRLMAKTLFLAQLVGRSSRSLLHPTTIVRSRSYKSLQELSSIVNKDTFELFRDMYTYNRFARSVPRKLLQQVQRIRHRLAKSPS